jgi:hypothetical protein
VIWDHPSSREIGGARSTTSEVCGQGGGEIAEVDPDHRSLGDTCQQIKDFRKISREFHLRVETPETRSPK